MKFRKVLLLDSCYSGLYGEPAYSGPARGWYTDIFAASEDLAGSANDGGYQLASNRGDESGSTSDGNVTSRIRGGLFTRAVVDGLQGGADLLRDDEVRTDELELYLRTRFQKSTGQQPSIKVSNTNPCIVLTRIKSQPN